MTDPATRTSTRWWLRTDSVTTDIAAPAERIYELVSDLPRMGEWSPECCRVEWIEGSTGPAVGSRFVGHNRDFGGLMRWSRRGTVRAAEAGADFSFATEEGGREGTVWRYHLEAIEGGTRVTESYEVEWIPAWARIVDVPTNRAGSLRRRMGETLDRLKAAAEAAAEA